MYYLKSLQEIFEEFQTDEMGLSGEEAVKRIQKYGENKLPEAKVDSLFVIFLRQFKSPLIYVLLAASLVIFTALNQTIDALVILGVLLFNAIVGTIQEGKSQNTLAALKKFIETDAVVLRDKKEIIILDSQVVPGDIIILREGEKVPADARIVHSNSLKIDQAVLIGESESVFKISGAISKPDLGIADQQNMVFKGTHVVSGNGAAIAVATGINTFIGKISQKIALIDKEIPLQKDIQHLSRVIIFSVFAISVFLFFSGYVFFGKTFQEMFGVAVALSVSVIPEGLPIVVTLVLATGVWRMAKRNAVVKRLQAVEALGQTKIIAVDKTGTITKNELVVQKVFIPSYKIFEISGIGYESRGETYLDGKLFSAPDCPELIFAGKVASFCANAQVLESKDESGGVSYRVIGDPTEAALLVFSEKMGFQKEIIDVQHPLIKEKPFDYKTKYHLTLRQVEGKNFLTVVGAPEKILNFCRLSVEEKNEFNSVFHKMSGDGLRVLAFAYKDAIAGDFNIDDLHELEFGGFFGMKDGLRPEAKEAAQKAIEAGFRVVIITGDHKLTARAIAEEAGIFREGDEILTGEEIDDLPEKEFINKLEKVSIFARVSPEHKIKIIEGFKKRKEIIAMTGDGVNDAPALVAADLGVAMGKIGTEVAKEASDIVLLDDNFLTIVSAIEEGRSIYKTIKKVILYLFSTSLGEVLTIVVALFLGYPLPLLASQIIWLNFVTDGFLDMALAMEPKEENLLKNWRKKGRHLVDFSMFGRMLIMALPMAAGSLFIFQKYLAEFSFEKAITMSLVVLAIFQWFNAWNCRSEEKSFFKNPFSNKWLNGALVIVISLQLLAVYHPFLQKILHTVPLGLIDWAMAIGVALSVVMVEELRKFIARKI